MTLGPCVLEPGHAGPHEAADSHHPNALYAVDWNAGTFKQVTPAAANKLHSLDVGFLHCLARLIAAGPDGNATETDVEMFTEFCATLPKEVRTDLETEREQRRPVRHPDASWFEAMARDHYGGKSRRIGDLETHRCDGQIWACENEIYCCRNACEIINTRRREAGWKRPI